MTLLVTMNREKSIQQLREYHATNIAEDRAKAAEDSAQIEELDVELATIKEAAGINKESTTSYIMSCG
jgi:DNA-binding protein H-NS